MSTPTFEPDVFVNVTREQYLAWLAAGQPISGPAALPAGAVPITAEALNRLGAALAVLSVNVADAATAAALQALSGQVTTLSGQVSANTSTITGKYTKPSGGIPLSDLASAVVAYFATPAQVDTRIQAIINGAPAALDTLGEIAAQLAADESAAAAIAGRLTSAEGNITANASAIAGKTPAVFAADPAFTATYRQVYSPALAVALGDSQTAGTLTPGLSYPAMVAALTERRIAVVNKGIGGNTTAQMLARLSADVLALKPRMVLFMGGTNDIATQVSPATTRANIKAIADAVTAGGAEFVVATIPPRSQHSTTVGTSLVRDLNTWLRLWAAAKGYRLVDVNAVLVNPRNGEYASGLSVDAVHPSAAGMMLMAQAFAGVLLGPAASHVPSVLPIDGEVDYIGQMPANTAYSAQILTNPLLWPTASDGVTDPTLPDYWTMTTASGATPTLGNADARFIGYARKVVASAQSAAWSEATTLPTATWKAGDKLRLIARLACDASASIPTGKGASISLTFSGPGTTASAVTQWVAVTPSGIAPVFAVDVVVPAGATAATVTIAVDVGSGSGTFSFGQVGVVNLTTLDVADIALAA